MFIFDAHLDLAMNALEWNRDLTWTVEDIRKSEKGMTAGDIIDYLPKAFLSLSKDIT